MKKRMYVGLFMLLFYMIFAVTALPITAKADMGPKPSVRIQFKNMGDDLCYGTLLSREKHAGPARVWDGTARLAQLYDLDRSIWKAFVDYKDSDGYYFLQRGWTVSETGEIAWTYYPPENFKILLYYPETETFVSSGSYERYAFDTYYTVDMEGVRIGSVEYNENLSTNERINAYRSYNYRKELLSLAVRILLTIAIEMAVALLFGFRQKKQLQILALVNITTQLLLNLLLNIIHYNAGPLAFITSYVFFEVIVFVLEAGLYCRLLKKVSERKENWYYVLYSFVANSASFWVGYYLATVLPGIF
ncbi:hypothetical protein LI187_06060 [bacterium 210820-DFI.6.38]|nr:hypothetical protein [bacterium 210820-DFI.6.38]